jgi:sugar phosphate isomerase/epimerase
MNLALSNFAWDNQDSETIFKSLKDNGINNIESVLTKIKDWSELNTKDIVDYKKYLDDNKIIPYSIQSLFYGVKCDDITNVNVIKLHFEKLIYYSKILGVKVLVFGSPGLRKKTKGWEDSLVEIFNHVDNILVGTDIKVLIEPNTSSYGGEFFHTVSDIVNFIESNNLKNVRTMIDTHNSLLENLDPNVELVNYFNYIEHIHISEPKLVVIKEDEFHINFSKTIKNSEYNKTITYEVMKSIDLIPSIKTFSKIYR